MVDIGAKPNNERVAVAAGKVVMHADTARLIQDAALKKGDALSVARIAGVMAAKQTANLIPLCHPIPLTSIGVDIHVDETEAAVHIRATARTVGKTGVEMEALTAASVAALTIYDMAKAVDRGMIISDIRLLEKRGGVRGDYVAAERDSDNAD